MKTTDSRRTGTIIGLIMLSLSLVVTDARAAATTVKVCPDGTGAYTTIQSAVNAVDTGSTLRLCEATFSENVTISGKTLYLRSIGDGEDTILDGGGRGPVVQISGAANVTLFDLTLQNGNGAGGGGGVRCEGSTLTLDSSLVQGNSGTRGGGVFSNTCSLLIKYSEISGNIATMRGGGIAAENSSGLIRDSVISGNESVEGGGMYLWGGTLTVKLNDITDNEASTTDETLYGPGGGGGGLFVYGSIPIKDNLIDANSSGYNGGGLYVYQGSADIEGNTITNNVAGRDGAGIYTNYNSSAIYGNDVSYNEATDDGGGIRVYVGYATLQDNVVTYNTAGDDGGGIKVSHAHSEILDNTVTGNVAADGGGGIELDNDTSVVDGNTISSNKAGNGGGLHAEIPEGALTITNNTIHSNTATEVGGGLSIESAPYGGTLSGLDLYKNKGPYGGGLYALDASFDLSNSLIDSNSASTSGGGLYLDGTSGDLGNLTLFNNSSLGGSGLVLVDTGTTHVYNTILNGNDRSAAVTVSGAGALTWTYNDVFDHTSNYSGMTDPTGTNGNLAVNPKFTDTATRDFTLKSTSACIDAGDPAVSDEDGTRSDMGALGGAGF